MTWRRWDEAWQEALYGHEGFYRRAAPAEHFATSAQGLGSSGLVLAQALLELAARHGLTHIVEVAAGHGELLAAIAAGGQQGVALTGVDIVGRPSDLPPEVGWLRSPGGAALPESLTNLTSVLVVAHEWLDVVPCPVAERDPGGSWRHVMVDASGAERPGEPAAGEDLAWLSRHVPDHVERAEIGLPRDTAYANLVSRVETGLVLAIDYGHTASTRPRAGTLTGYRDGTQVPPVPDGTCDLTAHVAVDSLAADQRQTQREALHDLLGPARLPPHELSRTDPTAYLTALTRANALATLTAREGLGGFWWATSLRGGTDLG